ncbi:MAG: 2,3-bisphosphoglycerate-independent phosphoglycerate mutase [Bacillota bacterium]
MVGRVPRPLALIVLDGWGISDQVKGNATLLARTPTMDELKRRYPWSKLQACGEAVGLMPGQMGDSNVGHLNLGAGRVVYQDLVRINRAIAGGDFFKNPALLSAIEHVKRTGGKLHLMGLLSDGGVHSHQGHLYALLQMAAQHCVQRVLIHCFTDGRDTPPTSGMGFMQELEAKTLELGIGRVATVAGRYYAMDRDKRWERTKKAFDAIVHGIGREAHSGVQAVGAGYRNGETDEFIAPTVVLPRNTMEPGDAVIFFNFRADRARQLTHALVDEGFSHFERGSFTPVYLVGMAQYEEGLNVPAAFPRQYPVNTFGQVISERGLRQLRIAETEKYAHVTFFFNGMQEEIFPGEDRVLIPSPKVATYDLKPEMSAYEVTEETLKRIASGVYDVIIMNYANPDMVGHTGRLEAAIRAVETVDDCLGKVIGALRDKGGAALICGDHGNVEQMIDEATGQPHTAHTSNPVPCILVDDRLVGYGFQGDGAVVRLRDGILADVAPTLLEILGIDKPAEMDGHSLLEVWLPDGRRRRFAYECDFGRKCEGNLGLPGQSHC